MRHRSISGRTASPSRPFTRDSLGQQQEHPTADMVEAMVEKPTMSLNRMATLSYESPMYAWPSCTTGAGSVVRGCWQVPVPAVQQGGAQGQPMHRGLQLRGGSLRLLAQQLPQLLHTHLHAASCSCAARCQDMLVTRARYSACW